MMNGGPCCVADCWQVVQAAIAYPTFAHSPQKL